LKAAVERETWPTSPAAAAPDDVTLHRVLLARNGDPVEALKLLRPVWEFQCAYPPGSPALHCERCVAVPTAHSFLPIGVTNTHRYPIVYGCPARAVEPDVDPVIHHVSSQLVHALHAPGSGHYWVWLVAFDGFGFTHAMQVSGRIGREGPGGRCTCEVVGGRSPHACTCVPRCGPANCQRSSAPPQHRQPTL